MTDEDRESNDTIAFHYNKNQQNLLQAMDDMKACLLKANVPFEADTITSHLHALGHAMAVFASAKSDKIVRFVETSPEWRSKLDHMNKILASLPEAHKGIIMGPNLMVNGPGIPCTNPMVGQVLVLKVKTQIQQDIWHGTPVCVLGADQGATTCVVAMRSVLDDALGEQMLPTLVLKSRIYQYAQTMLNFLSMPD